MGFVFLMSLFACKNEKPNSSNRLAKDSNLAIIDDCKSQKSGHQSNREIDGLRYISSGCFLMGSSLNEYGRKDDETPHQVNITYGFYLQTYEVTQAEWRALMGNNLSIFSSCDNCAVSGASWYDAIAYANALSESRGVETCYDLSSCEGTPGLIDYKCDNRKLTASLSCGGFRLPTEAEWEYAARAGTSTALYEGDLNAIEIIDKRSEMLQIAWCGEGRHKHQYRHPLPGGKKLPNGFGLYDMLGNVGEHVWDWYGEYPLGHVENPTGPIHGSKKVSRGGTWQSPLRSCRSASRNAHPPQVAAHNGIRLAMTQVPQASEGIRIKPSDKPVVQRRKTAINNPLVSELDINWLQIPSGVYKMGSGVEETLHATNEQLHQVALSRPFLLQSTEVTQGQWMALMGNNPSFFVACGEKCPVDSVSFFDALSFANRLSDQEGLAKCYDLSSCSGTPGESFSCSSAIAFSLECDGYRLPTEAEWEYTSTAGSAFHISEDYKLISLVVPGGSSPEYWAWPSSLVEYPSPVLCGVPMEGAVPCGPHQVGSSMPNTWGAYDLLGNVHEWTWDVYKDKLKEDEIDPCGPPSGTKRVVRGGGWNSVAWECRSAARSWRFSNMRNRDLGFRLVRSFDAKN